MINNIFSEDQIISILKEHELGKAPEDIFIEYKISETTFYQWRHKYVNMNAQQIKHILTLKKENARLKRMFADLSLEHEILKDIVEKRL